MTIRNLLSGEMLPYREAGVWREGLGRVGILTGGWTISFRNTALNLSLSTFIQSPPFAAIGVLGVSGGSLRSTRSLTKWVVRVPERA